MKNVNIANILLLLFIVLFGNIPSIAIAQKLPKIQQTGKRAPADIKIDGKTIEWNDELQAYNINNRIYYTISNDDNNIYLTVRASDGYGNEKSIFGISFSIKLPSEKSNKSKENVAVTFPTVIDVQKGDPIRYNISTIRRLQHDTTNKVKKRIDSLRLLVNKNMNNSFKEINISGIKEIQEPSISIYNMEGIKAAAQLNDHMQYIYELAIPLKYLSPSINSGQKFSYNIKMNGVPQKAHGTLPPPEISGNIIEFMGADNAYVQYPTDFSGVYTLVKR